MENLLVKLTEAYGMDENDIMQMLSAFIEVNQLVDELEDFIVMELGEPESENDE